VAVEGGVPTAASDVPLGVSFGFWFVPPDTGLVFESDELQATKMIEATPTTATPTKMFRIAPSTLRVTDAWEPATSNGRAIARWGNCQRALSCGSHARGCPRSAVEKRL
jgi:hypothetical protein